MVKVVGEIKVKAKIKGIVGAQAVTEVGKAVFVAADAIKVDAQNSITEGSVSGKGHVPSAPGEPPNADTHDLDRQIESRMVAPMKAHVSSNSHKSRYLEHGTSRMAARPFMSPAAQRNRRLVARLVRQAIDRLNKRA